MTDAPSLKTNHCRLITVLCQYMSPDAMPLLCVQLSIKAVTHARENDIENWRQKTSAALIFDAKEVVRSRLHCFSQ